MSVYLVDEYTHDEPRIARLDVIKETPQRVYFDSESLVEIMGHTYFVPRWKPKDSKVIFNSLEDAYAYCLSVLGDMAGIYADKIKKIELKADDIKHRLLELKEADK